MYMQMFALIIIMEHVAQVEIAAIAAVSQSEYFCLHLFYQSVLLVGFNHL